MAKLPADASHNEIVRMGWRSFDQQWTFDDPRLITWNGRSVAVTVRPTALPVDSRTMTLGTGPAITASIGVPDLHYFRVVSFRGEVVCRSTRDQERQSPTSRADFSTC
ncbi:hypothetical protein GS909_18630 [Rhodococcus hoagii]|nr:hypothetical protein [Prescottella equi]